MRTSRVRLCAELGLTLGARFGDGSLPVYALEAELVLKLYPPPYADERVREVAMLEVLAGRLPIATPSVERSGERGGWGHLVMSRLPGVPISSIWSSLAARDRERLSEDLGTALAVLHSIREPRLVSVVDDWASFIAVQRESAVERQRSRGLEPRWLEQIPGFLRRVELPARTTEAILHTEITREHVLVRRGASGYALSGLLDFEPSMLGAPEYEFASVGVFFSCGDAAIVRRLLLGYGLPDSELDAAFSERLLA